MVCSNCNGYYSCGCDILKMREQIKIKKLEIVDLEQRVEKRVQEFNKDNEGHSKL